VETAERRVLRLARLGFADAERAGTLLGPVVGCVMLMWFTNALGGQQIINSSLVLGATLLVFVMALPAGLLPTLRRLGSRVLPVLLQREKDA